MADLLRCLAGLLLLTAVAGCASSDGDGDDAVEAAPLSGYWGAAERTAGGDCLAQPVRQELSAWVVEEGKDLGIGFFTLPSGEAPAGPAGWMTCALDGEQCAIDRQVASTADEYLDLAPTTLAVEGGRQIVGHFAIAKMRSDGPPCTLEIDVKITRSPGDLDRGPPPAEIAAVTPDDFPAGGWFFSTRADPVPDACPLFLYRDCEPGSEFDEALCLCVWQVE